MRDDHKDTATERGHAASNSESWLSRHAPYILLLVYLYYCTQIAMDVFVRSWWFNDWLSWLSEMLPLAAIALIVLMAAALLGVAFRIVGHVARRAPGTAILNDILGEPTWWRTWYPRTLRDPASVWDRLPPTLKVTRTAIWLGLLLLPAGLVMVVFVLPTFQMLYRILGFQFPSVMHTYSRVVTAGGYVLPVVILAGLVQASRWRARHGLPRWVALTALFSVSQDFWRDTDARKLLTS